METLKIKKLRPDAVLPAKATSGSAGYDLCACLDRPLTVPAHGREKIPTGLAVSIRDPGVVGLVFGRSGLGSRLGVTPSNSVGVVDSDYRGELLVPLANHGDEDFTVSPGDRIAQLLFVPVFSPRLVECPELDDTERGPAGFGSTGSA